MFLVSRFWKLRVSPREERLGLNIVEHGASTEVLDMLREMQSHRREGNFHRLVAVEPFTEVGQIATAYNRVLKSVGGEINKRKEAEKQFRDIYENAVEGIFQSSLDGRFLSANSSLIKTYGYSSFEEMQTKLASIERSLYIQPNRRQEFLAVMEQQDVINDFRSQVYRADGSIIWISETVRCVRDSIGKLKYFEGTVIDITHRMETESLRYEMAQTQAANKAKTEFLANLSHEIRTPLGGVISMLSLMSESTSAREREHYLRIAQQSSTTLLSLINDVLDLSKVEAGSMDLESAEFNLESLLDETLDMLYHRAREKGLRIVFNLSSDSPRWLRGDSTRLKQVVINLVGNAVKFTETGHIKVDVSPSKDPLKSGYLRFSVTDSGIGIATDRQQAIFQPFIQADASTTRKYGGTGLGLTICERIVRAMQGTIDVQSELGVGSVFSFEIPVKILVEIPVAVTEKCPRQVQGALNDTRILFICDVHIESRFVLEKLLTFGANATICDPNDLQKILEAGRSQKQPYHLIILDGEYCGTELARIAKQVQPDIKVILMGSASDTTSCDEQLLKPISPSRLLQAIDQTRKREGKSADMVERKSSRTVIENCFGSNQKLLIVDDNEVNRIIACEVVRRLGFDPTAVCSGREAIDACQHAIFAGILVDCEMPEMDGHETTQRIRQLHSKGLLAIPASDRLIIIALTAQVVAESRSRCLQSGMDDYLTKPIDRKIFAQVLRQYLNLTDEPHDTSCEKSDGKSNKVSEEAPIQWMEALDRCGGREDALRKVLKMFSQKGIAQLNTMKRYSETGEYENLARSAHTLRGSSGNLSAYRISKLAESIETNSKIVDPIVVKDSLRQLEAEMDRCVIWIQDRLEDLS